MDPAPRRGRNVGDLAAGRGVRRLGRRAALRVRPGARLGAALQGRSLADVAYLNGARADDEEGMSATSEALPLDPTKLVVATLSEPGRVRSDNQDMAVVAGALSDEPVPDLDRLHGRVTARAQRSRYTLSWHPSAV